MAISSGLRATVNTYSAIPSQNLYSTSNFAADHTYYLTIKIAVWLAVRLQEYCLVQVVVVSSKLRLGL